MGDRSNVFVRQDTTPDGDATGIGVYSHWGGSAFQRKAIECLPLARGRIGDETYFARILIHNLLIGAADPGSETGHGLWTESPPDNEHPILVIDANTGHYGYCGEHEFRTFIPTEGGPNRG